MGHSSRNPGAERRHFFHWNDMIKPLSFGPRRLSRRRDFLRPPLAKQARNRDHHSSDPCGQTKNEHSVAEKKRHARVSLRMGRAAPSAQWVTDGVSLRTSVRRPSGHGAAQMVNVRLRQRLSPFAAPPRRLKDHSRRQLLANAAIAASHVAEKTRVGCGICADS